MIWSLVCKGRGRSESYCSEHSSPQLTGLSKGGGTLKILGGAGWTFLEINLFVGKMGEINKWPQGMVDINILSTKEVEINIM